MYHHAKTPVNDGVHIERIIEGVSCEKHNAEAGAPCWTTYLTSSEILGSAICGSRVRKFGFVGEVSPSSVAQKSATKNYSTK